MSKTFLLCLGLNHVLALAVTACKRKRVEGRRAHMSTGLHCNRTLMAALMIFLCGARRSNAQQASRGTDTTCAACANFFDYANANATTAKLPARLAKLGASVDLQRSADSVALLIIHDAMRKANRRIAPASDDETRLGLYYESCVDSARADALGVEPIQATLDRIDSVKSIGNYMRVLGDMQRTYSVGFVSAGPSSDARDPHKYIAVIGFTSGLGLPNRDYYVRTDGGYPAIRSAYLSYLQTLFALAGDAPAKASAEARVVMDLETALALAQPTPNAARDPRNSYNPMTPGALRALSPDIDWNSFLRGSGAPPVALVNARYPAALHVLDSLMTAISLDRWKTLLRAEVLSEAAPTLSGAFVTARSNFDAKLGNSSRFSRAERCADQTRTIFGDVIGREYVRRAFSLEARRAATTMVGNLIAVLRARINRFTWMSDSTRAMALSKLDSMGRKIGYPDSWRSYAALEVKKGQYAANRARATQFASAARWRRLSQSVDRSAWRSSPATAGAFYGAPFNDITILAAMLQPPIFEPRGDVAANYGAAGSVIAHELTHAFDVIGGRYDATGALRDWWTKDDAARYNDLTGRLVEQFSEYPIDSTHHVNGTTTLAENIADLGGLSIAFEAMERSLPPAARGPLKGFTPEQRFFLAFGRLIASTERGDIVLNSSHATHSPPKWRANGPMSNMLEFTRAWKCKLGDPMFRSDSARVVIW